jgi:hypothetical protein
MHRVAFRLALVRGDKIERISVFDVVGYAGWI